MEEMLEQHTRPPNLDTSGHAEFRKEYREHAILQKGFHAVLIEDTVQFVLRTMPQALKEPIRVLDLCCGNGDFTVALEKALSQNGIQIEQMVGYDISKEQIATAQHYHGSQNAKVRFYEQDVARTTDEARYDLVVSYFGLHWLHDSNNLMQRIARSLKPQGKLVFFVPLEKRQLFTIRNLLREGEFKNDFGTFQLTPFKESTAEYLDALHGFFSLENEEGVACQIAIDYSQEQFEQFLRSWLPELRTVLQDDKRGQDYLQAIWQAIPNQEPDESCPPSLAKKSGGKRINFFERALWVHACVNTLDQALEQTCDALKKA